MALVKYILKKDDFKKLRDSPTSLRDRAILMLLYCTGMRTGELATMKVSDVDLHNKTIKIIDSKKKIPFTLPITDECVALLAKYICINKIAGPATWLFPSRFRTEKHITTRGIQWIIKRCAARMNLKNWEIYNPRLFRYRIARYWMWKGGNLLKLSDVLRHQRISTTGRYVGRIRFECEEKELREEYDSVIKKREKELLSLSTSYSYSSISICKSIPQILRTKALTIRKIFFRVFMRSGSISHIETNITCPVIEYGWWDHHVCPSNFCIGPCISVLVFIK